MFDMWRVSDRLLSGGRAFGSPFCSYGRPQVSPEAAESDDARGRDDGR